MQAKHIDEHEKLECSRADASCGNRCGLYVPLGDMKRHYAESCAHRFVPCGLGCGYRVRAKVREQIARGHETREVNYGLGPSFRTLTDHGISRHWYEVFEGRKLLRRPHPGFLA